MKESFNYSETDMIELHFSYILESEIKVHSDEVRQCFKF